MDVNAFIGRRIRRRRRLMGMTHEDLGVACGVSLQQIQLYESAHTRVSIEMLWKLACALDVGIDYFFLGLSCHAPAAPALRLPPERVGV